ncbi:keratin, type I cytoskeletal 19-like [Acanthochromis polyacanthus]|uniref:keratin, type I cytoskeletal 19-like n=1 Tax=Acanthochromis polyacanthus TaxID=80966 RepID=UPI0022340F85|nr:keratin, type I cytoskeletal 19-like [Acanthochromis polyacanthus]
MSVVQQRSFSAHSLSSSSRSISSVSQAGGWMQQGRISTGPYLGQRAFSVYGGAGQSGVRISTSVFPADSLSPFGGTSVIGDEKVTMQNLNDRLASYLAKVRSLESANRKLELQIKEFYDKRTPSVTTDHAGYFATIAELRDQIARRHSENQSVILQIDNAQLAAEDFRVKYEIELNMRTTVEADVARLRGVRDSLTLGISDLELRIEGLKEELLYLKKNHEEEMSQVRIQQSGNVNVEVDSAQSVDLTKVLEEMREQYESVMVKNKLELEKWFQTKVDSLQTQIITQTTTVKESSSQLSELKRSYQSLEINRQSLHTEMQLLQQNLEDVKSRYSIQLSQLQMTITALETELQQIRLSIEQQQISYSQLLDIKMRLELEIAEYRRLLEGEQTVQKKSVVISKVIEKVEEHKPHVERRVKTIVEEIVDGRIVSSEVDTQVETIQ